MWVIEKTVSKGDYNYAIVRDHPNRTKNDYVLEHRVVMENILGRMLSKEEVVHHKDGNKKNNSPDNLEVMTNKEHAKLHGAEKIRAIITLSCPHCGEEFTREKRQTYGRANVFCSRSCNAKYTRARGRWLGKTKP